MNTYKVKINDNEYDISVENMLGDEMQAIERSDPIKNNEDYSAASSYVLDAVKKEYDYCLQRSEKLDNKIYISLTVLAFLFVLLCSVIGGMKDISLPQSAHQLEITIIFYVILLLTTGLFIYVLINLALLLKGVDVARFDSKEALKANLTEQKPEVTSKFISMRYLFCIDENYNKLQNRYKKFNRCVYCIIPIVISLIILAFIQNWI